MINVVKICKTRSYVLRFKNSYDIELTHGRDEKFRWTVRRSWEEIEDLFDCIKKHKEGPNALTELKDKLKDNIDHAVHKTTSQFHLQESNHHHSQEEHQFPKFKQPNAENISQKVYENTKPSEYDNLDPYSNVPNVVRRTVSRFNRFRSKKKDPVNNCIRIHFPSEKDDIEGVRQWLQVVLNSRELRTLKKLQKFLCVTRLSFIEDFGSKRSEIVTKKFSGGYFGQSKFFHYLQNSWIWSKFSRSWSEKMIVVKDSCICYLSTFDSELRGVMLFDNQFFAEPGHFSNNVVISNASRILEVKCSDHHDAKNLLDSISDVVEDEKTDGHLLIKDDLENKSFAPIRKNSLARPFVCGREYFWYLSCILEAAKTEIFIADWFFSPEVSLRRPDPTGYWKIKNILLRKAREGVRISVLLYAAEIGLDHGLEYSEKVLTGPESFGNIQFLKHQAGIEQRYLFSHHEKLAIIDQKIAFVGGIDICIGRYDDHHYQLFDTHNDVKQQIFNGKDYQNPFKEDYTSAEYEVDQLDRDVYPRMPWQDISSVVYGQAAVDVARHFILRWNFTKTLNPKIKATLLLPISTTSETCRVTENEFLYPELETVSFNNFNNFTEKISNRSDRISDSLIDTESEIFESNTQTSSPISRQIPPPRSQAQAQPAIPEHLYSVNCQILRSLSQWSGGINEIEYSIQNAYINLITNSKKYIYIENQFFITNSYDNPDNLIPEVQNKIGLALINRIAKAFRNKEKFKIYIVMPLMPCFKGDIKAADKSAEAVKAILHFQYSSICREDPQASSVGGAMYWNLYKACKVKGVTDPSQYINFSSLRTHEWYKDKIYSEIVYVHSKGSFSQALFEHGLTPCQSRAAC